MAKLFPWLLRRIGGWLRSGNDVYLPLILKIGRAKTLEELQNELCACRRLARDKTRAASEAFAISTNLRHKLDEQQARNVELTQKLAAYDQLVIAQRKDIGWLRAENGRLDAERIEFRNALKQITDDLTEGVDLRRAERLRLVPWPFPSGAAAIMAGPISVAFLASDGDGDPVMIALAGRTRKSLSRIVEQLLPRVEDVKVATDQHESEAKP